MSEHNHQDEIDFLMEQEYALEAQLDRIRGRLGFLMGATAVAAEVRPERHLHVVRGGEPDGA